MCFHYTGSSLRPLWANRTNCVSLLPTDRNAFDRNLVATLEHGVVCILLCTGGGRNYVTMTTNFHFCSNVSKFLESGSIFMVNCYDDHEVWMVYSFNATMYPLLSESARGHSKTCCYLDYWKLIWKIDEKYVEYILISGMINALNSSSLFDIHFVLII